jgi:hypothetical protein
VYARRRTVIRESYRAAGQRDAFAFITSHHITSLAEVLASAIAGADSDAGSDQILHGVVELPSGQQPHRTGPRSRLFAVEVRPREDIVRHLFRALAGAQARVYLGHSAVDGVDECRPRPQPAGKRGALATFPSGTVARRTLLGVLVDRAIEDRPRVGRCVHSVSEGPAIFNGRVRRDLGIKHATDVGPLRAAVVVVSRIGSACHQQGKPNRSKRPPRFACAREGPMSRRHGEQRKEVAQASGEAVALTRTSATLPFYENVVRVSLSFAVGALRQGRAIPEGKLPPIEELAFDNVCRATEVCRSAHAFLLLGRPAVDATLLITIVVRKSADLVATVATQGGSRHSLAEVPNRFHEALAEALDARNVPRKVAAEMFGVGLRTHQRRLKQAHEAPVTKRETLSARVYRLVSVAGESTKLDIELAFQDVPAHLLASALRDLQKNDLLLRTQHGAEVRFATTGRSGVLQDADEFHVLQHFLSALVHRLGPVRSRDLCPLVDEPLELVESALQTLEHDGFLASEGPQTARQWVSRNKAMPRKAGPRRLATLGDHFVAVLTNLMGAVEENDPETMDTSPSSAGTSVAIEVPEGHALVGELHEAFRVFRTTVADIQKRAEGLEDAGNTSPPVRLSSYAGTRVSKASSGGSEKAN